MKHQAGSIFCLIMLMLLPLLSLGQTQQPMQLPPFQIPIPQPQLPSPGVTQGGQGQKPAPKPAPKPAAPTTAKPPQAPKPGSKTVSPATVSKMAEMTKEHSTNTAVGGVFTFDSKNMTEVQKQDLLTAIQLEWASANMEQRQADARAWREMETRFRQGQKIQFKKLGAGQVAMVPAPVYKEQKEPASQQGSKH